MKLVTFTHPETGATPRAGLLHRNSIVDPFAVLYASYGGDVAAARAAAEAPRDMLTLLGSGALTSGALDGALELADNAAQAGNALAGPDGEAGVVSSSAA